MTRLFRFLVLAALASFAILACTSQLDEPRPETSPDPVLSEGEMAIRISSELTRSTLKDDIKVVWEKGDEIAVWDGTAIRKFTAWEGGSDNMIFTGSANEAEEYWVLYPWSESLTVDASDPANPVFNTSVPLSQSLRKNSFARGAALCLGKGPKEGISLKHVCGFIKFRFPDAAITALEPGSLNHIVLTSLGGKKLGGSVSLSLQDGIPVATGSAASGDNVLDLSFEERPAASTSYYISALPADLGTTNGGIKLNFSRSEDKAVAEISGGAGKTNLLNRREVLDLGKIWVEWRAAEEDAFDSSSDPSGSVSYFRLGHIHHPYILASDEDWRNLNELLAKGTYPLLTAKHNHTIANADSYLGKAIPTISELVVGDDGTYKNTFNEKLARPTIGHLVCCAYAYRTTKQKKYLDECKTVIAQRLKDAFWWKSDVAYLSPAEITMGMAIAYDWLYYDLTLAERSGICAALKSKPFLYGTYTDESRVEGQLKNEKNNRGQVHNAGILAAALAVYDKDKAFTKKWVEKSLNAIGGVVDYVYGTSGSTEEGYGYWTYGATYQSWYNEMLMTAFGTDCGIGAKQGFVRTPEYYLYMSDHISSFAFSDGGRSSISSSQALWWMAATRRNSSLLITEKYLYDHGTTGAHRVMPIVPIALAKNPPIDLNNLSRPITDVWADNNDASSPVVLVRTGWTNTSSDKYLGLKGGYGAVSHGHMDAGTFEYHAAGQRWSIDSSVGGYAHYTNAGLSGSSQTGSSIKWLALAYNSLGHSTISFANYDQSIGGVAKAHATDHLVASSAKVPIVETYSTSSEKGGKINMLPALKGQVAAATRKAVIVNDDYLLVEDEITALPSQNAQMIWRMLTPASCKIVDGGIRMVRGGKVMFLKPEVSGGIKPTLRIWGPFDDAHPGKTGEWGWTASDYKVSESQISGYVIGFTLTIPKGTAATVSTTIKETAAEDFTPDYSLTLDFSIANSAFTTSIPSSKTTGTKTYVTKTGGYNMVFKAVEKGGNSREAGWYYGGNTLKFYPDLPYTSSDDPAACDGFSLPVIPGKRLVKVSLTTGSATSFRAYVVNADGSEVCEDNNPDILNSNGNWMANVTAEYPICNSMPGDTYRLVGRAKSSFIYIKTLKLDYKTE